MKQDLIKQFNLPKYIKGKSFADASKSIQDKFKDREDDASKRTMTELLGRLRNAQEYTKQVEMAKQNEAMPQGEMQPPQAMQPFAFGGPVGPVDPNKKAQAMSTEPQGKINTVDPKILRSAGQDLSTGNYTAEQLARFQKVRDHGGSFDPSLQHVNENMGHIWKPLERHTAAQTKIDKMRAGSADQRKAQKALDRDIAIYNQQMGNKARVADYMMGTGSAQPFAMGGNMDQNQYFFGGLFKKKDAADATDTDSKTPNAGAIVGGAQGLMGMGMAVAGDEHADKRSGIQASKGALSGAATGAGIGGMLGPKGALIGAGIGAIGGGLTSLLGGGKEAKKEEKKAQEQDFLAYNKSGMNQRADGGYINKYKNGGNLNPLDPNLLTNPLATTGTRDHKLSTGPAVNSPQVDITADTQEVKDATPQQYANIGTFDASNYMGMPNADRLARDAKITGRAESGTEEDKILKDSARDPNRATETERLQSNKWNESVVPEAGKKGEGDKKGNWLKDNYGNILRYAPVAANLAQYLKNKDAEVERYDRLDRRYKHQFMDERRMLNAIDEGFNPNAMVEASGGSLGRLGDLNLASQLNKMKAKAVGAKGVAEQEASEKTKGQSFDKDTDIRNQAIDTQETIANAQNRANLDTQRSKFLSQMGTELGQIGKEEVFKKQAKQIYGYTWDGKYYVNDKGEKKTKEEMAKQMEDQTQKMFGGYLRKKRK